MSEGGSLSLGERGISVVSVANPGALIKNTGPVIISLGRYVFRLRLSDIFCAIPGYRYPYFSALPALLTAGRLSAKLYRTEFYDNDNDFVKVAKYRNSELISIGKHQPKWLKELLEYMG